MGRGKAARVLVFALVGSAVVGGLTVDGDASCPAAAELGARFHQLAPDTGSGHRATVSQAGPSAVDVKLTDGRGVVLAERHLEASTCQALTEAAAATLLAWEALFPSAKVEAPAPRSPLPAGGDGAPAAVGPPAPWSWRATAAVVAALSGASPRPGAALAFELGPSAALWFGRVSAKAAWPFDATLAGGRVEWFRPTLGFGPGFRLLDSDAWHVSAHAAFEVGLVSARGRGFEDNRVATAFDPAIGGAVHVRRTTGPRTAMFAEVGASVFLVGQVAQVAGVLVNLPLPPITAEVRLGFCFGS